MSILPIENYEPLKMPENFLDDYKSSTPPWGFGPLSYVTYKRTYARKKHPSWLSPDGNGEQEDWWETCRRVIEGMLNVQRIHCKERGLPWDDAKAIRHGRRAYDKLFNFKWTPPGRGLWMMGTDFMFKRTGAALNNCGFVSTKAIGEEGKFAEPFGWMFEMSMLGVGVGFDTEGIGEREIVEPDIVEERHVVHDSREGWREILERILNAYVGEDTYPDVIDFSEIRPKGAPIRSFGGVASGPDPLEEALRTLESLYTGYLGQKVDAALIVDTMNIAGRCVVAGGVRRTAQVAFGDGQNQQFVELKQDMDKLGKWRWASNNSVRAHRGMDYSKLAESTAVNGEPGYFWLTNARKFSRLKDEPDYKDEYAEGSNPCVEQTLWDRELCCVSADTRILTRDGSYRIEDVVDQDVEVWNGEAWSTTTPFVAGKNKDLYRVHLSDGSYLDCTDDHRWSARRKTARKFRETMTRDLEVGMRLETLEVSAACHGSYQSRAWELGFYKGDGTTDGRLHAFGEKIDVLLASEYAYPINKRYRKDGYNVDTQCFRIDGVDNDTRQSVRQNGLPDWVFEMDKPSTLEFIAGWTDADGSVREQSNGTESYQVHGDERSIRDLQLLCRRAGINYTSINKEAEAGEETNFGVRTYDLWSLRIHTFESDKVPTRLKVVQTPGSRFRQNNRYPEGAPIDGAQKQYVVEIEKLDGEHTTYCFSEPEKNMGVFNNVLTYQCLVETFPAHHDSINDYKETLKSAYQYAKTVTLVSTHDEKTNAVMLRNRRIGCSMTGIVQAINKHGYSYFFEMCDKGYDRVQELDKQYSDWLCIPRSIKTTSVKPSGTVSLLAGSTPGVHWDHAPFYIRRIRVRDTHELVELCREAGYPVEPDESTPNTMVIEFPVAVDHLERTKHEVSVREKVDLAAQMQYWWSDNQVSCTAEFDPETEGEDIPRLLESYEHRLKAISFLPSSNHGYAQAPYEAISEEEYERRINEVEPLDGMIHHDQEDKFCDGEACTID